MAQSFHCRLLGYSQKVFEEYIKGAPSSKNFKQYHVARDVDSMTSYLKHKTEWDSSTTVFSKTVDRKTAHNRPAGFRELRTGAEPGAMFCVSIQYVVFNNECGMSGFLEYNPAITEERRSLRWASYTNSKYPWIKAASGYNVVAHYPSDGSISQFQIPSDLPSGKYILHWWWRGYFNCVDMDVVPKDKKVCVVVTVPVNAPFSLTLV